MLIRSMAPQIIACDEIGSKEDILAIKYALNSGVKGLFTMHGKNIEDVKNFSELSFKYSEELSTDKEFVFIK